MRVWEIIGQRLEGCERSLRAVATEAGVDAGNLSRFVRTGRGIGIEKLDRLMQILDVEIAPPPLPSELAWLERANSWENLLKQRFPGIDPAELRQIIVSIVRPKQQTRFLLRRIGGGYAL